MVRNLIIFPPIVFVWLTMTYSFNILRYFYTFIHFLFNITNFIVHRCGASGSMRACHAAGPGSIPGKDKFPGLGFSRGFSSPVRQMSGSFRPQGPRISFGHHYHPSSFITDANDL